MRSRNPLQAYLNPASFVDPAEDSFGTFVKGSLVGPHYADWDASLARKFPFTERVILQFRADTSTC